MNTDTLLLIAAEWIGVVALGMLAGLSPQLQKVKPLQFLFPRREASITFSLNAVIFFFSIIVYKYFFTIPTVFLGFNIEAGWQRTIIDLVALLVIGAALVYRKQPLRSALWGKDALRPNINFSLLIAAMIIFIRAKISAITNGVESIEGLALLQFLMISLCETTFFFGYSQPRLSSRFGPTTGWLISAALFTLWQVIPLSLHGAFGQDAIYQVLLAAGYGLIAGWISRQSKHNLTPAIYLALSQWLFLIK